MALKDLAAIAGYLAEHDMEAARDVAQHIWDAGQSLVDMPSRGRPGRVAETRELILNKYPYFLAYKVVQEEVQILRVLHSARRYTRQ